MFCRVIICGDFFSAFSPSMEIACSVSCSKWIAYGVVFVENANIQTQRDAASTWSSCRQLFLDLSKIQRNRDYSAAGFDQTNQTANKALYNSSNAT